VPVQAGDGTGSRPGGPFFVALDCACRDVLSVAGAAQADGLVAGLAHRYLCDGLSTYRLAQLTGVDRQRITRLLHRAGVPLRARGAGGTRPQRRSPDPPYLAALLTHLYLGQRLTTRQIGELLGMPEKRVRDRLRRHRIQVRTRGAWQREDRRSLPAGTLRTLYLQYGLTADEVSRELDASRKIVLRSAHDLGLPVRAAVALPPAAPAKIRLVRELYADECVQGALARHKIDPVPAGAPIWQRFPQPVPLTQRLVTDLYCGCGLAFSHVELITGQPASTVRGFMRRSGIASRPSGERSPFLQRCQGSPSPAGPSPIARKALRAALIPPRIHPAPPTPVK
jgi:hypothetical protein